MKKLLGILLTAVMVCTSMGVLGTGTESNVVFHVDFEDAKSFVDAGFTTANETYTSIGTYNSDVVALSTACGKNYGIIGDKSTTGTKDAWTYSSKAAGHTYEKNSTYKISFFYLSGPWGGSNAAPLDLDVTGIRCDTIGGFHRLPTSGANKWGYTEIYAVTPEGEGTVDVSIIVKTHSLAKYQYIDEFKIEKVNTASISFMGGTVSTDYAERYLVNAADANGAKYYTSGGTGNPHYAERTYGTEKIRVYARALNGTDKLNFSGKINVVSNYVPKTLGEKTNLVCAIYKNDANNMPVLKNVVIKEYTYDKTTTGLSGSTNFVVIPRAGTNHDLEIDASQYEAGCYMKAFMISNLSNLKSLSPIATLPAAQ